MRNLLRRTGMRNINAAFLWVRRFSVSQGN
jgi:hypothetical protein